MAALKLRLNVLRGMAGMRLAELVLAQCLKIAEDSSRPMSDRIEACRMVPRAMAVGSKVAEQLCALEEWASRDDDGAIARSQRGGSVGFGDGSCWRIDVPHHAPRRT